MRPSPERILDFHEFPVLYVDDEVENLRILELTFQREFSILTASSGEEGLEIINREPVAVVLSDHRMPGMTGVDFLSRVSELDPKTVRILVTAYGDAKTLQSAINNGSIYRFVPKPWTPEDMRITLRRGIEVYALDRERGQLLRELTLLNRISQSINQELEFEPLLELLLNTVIEDLGYDGAGILFFDARGEVLSWGRFAPNGDSGSEALHDLKITQLAAPSFMEKLRQGEPQMLGLEHALGMEAPVAHWVTEVAAEQILVAPLIGKSGVIGAFAVDNRRGGAKFTSDDQTLIEGLSTQAVIAIENARLVEDLRRSREQIRRADRLGTLGALAAGLAHEINNPLVSIHTFLSMAPDKRSEEDDEFWGDYHALACREVKRIRRLVDTMRRLGRDGGGGQAVPESFDPAELVQEAMTLLQREAGSAQVEMRLEREPDAPKIVAVKDHVHQVFLNLLLNAIHASPAGGKVRVRVFPDPAEEALCVEVTDSGPGIPKDHLDRIFDPFFTTKGPDQGTGLGLMICHRLVADHEGSIEVSSREGQGASFCVRLPLGSDLGSGPARPVA